MCGQELGSFVSGPVVHDNDLRVSDTVTTQPIETTLGVLHLIEYGNDND